MRLFTKNRQAGFTMVEIALSIAIVALGMVAIMGVLPTGMTVEKDNREDILINQEGQYWLEAVKSGARGMQDLTNYVEQIIMSNVVAKAPALTLVNNKVTPLQPEWIVGLLSTPKWVITNGVPMARKFTAITKALTGPAAEKGALTNEFSFRYAVEVAITQPVGPLDEIANGAPFGKQYLPEYFDRLSVTNLVEREQREQLLAYAQTMAVNLQEVKVTLRWPIMERGTNLVAGNRKKVFRTQISGTLEALPDVKLPNGAEVPLYYIKPNAYKHVAR